MKTPREILFKRHEAANGRLDVIRENVVAEHLVLKDGKERPLLSTFSPTFVAMKLWRELVWPCRRIWAGMAAVWVVILVFSLATSELKTGVADNAPPPTPDALMALKQQRQMMAQLLDRAATMPEIKPRVPGPRSEQRQTWVMG